MYEVEAKVPLTKADFNRLRKEIRKMAKLKGKSVKKDHYFGSTKEYLFRLRDKNGKGILNLKNKKVERGVEVNQEIELPITSVTKFEGLLKKLKIPAYISKIKESEVYLYKSFQIELNRVGGLGYFLEIERSVKTKTEIPKAKKEIREIFRKFGFSEKQFEKRYYIDLLAEKRRK